MMQLRNQGQILGEEREGDTVVATGRFEGEKLFASRVEVIPAGSVNGVARENGVAGEIVKRTENILTVDMNGALRTVEVLPDAQVIIPHIPGPNTVNQLKHHLEIQRMSKSKGNVVNPDELVQQYGADTVRAYLMFGFDWEKGGPWNSKQISGVVRWLNDVWDLATNPPQNETGNAEAERNVERRVHQTIKSVGERLETFNFNKAIAELMSLKNDIRDALRDGELGRAAWQEAVCNVVLMMAPFTPHIAEELWEQLGGAYSVHQQSWPTYDAAKATEDTTTLVIMKNGKPVERISVPAGIAEADAKQIALASSAAQRILNGGQPKKVIFVAGRTEGGQGAEPKVNIVV
jgi:leucyl-tRNA synthetase